MDFRWKSAYRTGMMMMKVNINKYIFSLLTLTSLLMSSCRDETLLPSPTLNNPDAVSFAAYSVATVGSCDSRSGEERALYGPLELKGDDNATLYLHTFESPRIGFKPGETLAGEGETTPLTRSNQIISAEDLYKFHRNFKVMARKTDDASTYIDWSDTQCNNPEYNIWFTSRTQYWPGQDVLAFKAVSPSSQFDKLKDFSTSEDRISFSYTAQKGAADRDAESQPDLLLAGSECNKKNSVDGRAPLKFHHALSSIKFAIRDVLGGEVVNIKIAGVKSSGNCIFTIDPSTGIGEVEWSGQSGTETYSQNFNYAVSNRVVDPADDTKDEILNNKMPEKTFMMIPQEIPEDAEIIVTLKRSGATPGTITVKGKIIANNVREWKPGHEYIYTISTSKSNWIYHLSATGNHSSTSGAHDVDGDQIYVYSPSNISHDKYGDEAYFHVRSFRYRANDMTYTENLPWTASHGDPVLKDGAGTIVTDHTLTAAEWILSQDILKGDGNALTRGEQRILTFKEHHIRTSWPGDVAMQNKDPYSGNSATNPFDLSLAGGNMRNTANCYVIDREGWYSIPMVYGNSITNNIDPYPAAFNGAAFVNHKGEKISDSWIADSYCRGAEVVWSDVYNTISDVEVRKINGKNMIVFRANKNNLQQGNVVIAAYDNPDTSIGTITWSWHIWITEHWLDTSGKCDALDGSSGVVPFVASDSGWRDRGDLLLNNEYINPEDWGEFYIAPYNLGWCDPKDIDYLGRYSTMKYVQKNPDGTPTGLTCELPIIQAESRIVYYYGNNTYYQWGRKDPMVGFVDHENMVKRNFGVKQYTKAAQPVSLDVAIREPHVLYCKGGLDDNDWSRYHYDYLWNSGESTTFGVKTVYDPCPPGYMVPSAFVLRFIGTDNDGVFTNNQTNNTLPLIHYQGMIYDEDDPYTFVVSTTKDKTRKPETSVWLVGTGNRWYTDNHPTLTNPKGERILGGDNFNPTVVYLWGYDPIKITSGYGMAFGIDSQYISDPAHPENVDKSRSKYVITSYFQGRKSMARPVRPIREHTK